MMKAQRAALMPMTEPISRSMPSAFEKSHLGSANKSIFPTAFCASAQANIACASFTAKQATASTPLAFSLSNFSTNPGICFAEQVGVKAPGTQNKTTLRPAQYLAVLMVSRPSLVFV